MVMHITFLILGVLSLLYFVGIFFFGSHGSIFYLIWGALGILCLVWANRGKDILDRMPGWLKKLSAIVLAVGILIFLIVEGMIISGFSKKGQAGLDYILVLGAQLKDTGPSYVLQKRLDEAYEYLINNPDTKVIVSGGQGSNEPAAEAQGMYDYLVERGISPERIIKEGESKNTSQNIRFSMEYMDVQNDTIGIVTSNFHIFRALKLAKAAGYQNVCGIAAPSHPGLLINNMLREFLGVVKDFLVGNL